MPPFAPDQWNDDLSRQGSREFLVQLEMWYSNKYAPNALRKSNTTRKKADKRDSLTQSSNQAEDNPRKLKERPSWFSISRVAGTNNSAGQWRAATCKLSEEGDNCVLNVYGEDNTLQHSLYVHSLRATDIRPVDRSLFFRPDCLGIHCRPGQGMSTFGFLEPIYFAFANSDAINTWVALLRSYAQPEVYGRRLDPAEGGLYRMWRQIEMSVITARNLRLGKTSLDGERSQSSFSLDASRGDDKDDQTDLDTFCEILISSEVSGRTTVQKGTGKPQWYENFTFPDLPAFGVLVINVWREKKLLKPSLVGAAEISLPEFTRGDFVENWYPVMSTNAPSQQVGEIRLKIKVDEEIILPSEAYRAVVDTLDDRNYLELLSELETKMRLEHISHHIMSLAVSRNMLMHDVCELAEKEVETSPSTQNTLFRGNTVLTKTMELSMSWYGKSFLESSLGSVIRRMCNERVTIEVDPIRNNKGAKDLDQNVKVLAYWCEEFWAQIWNVRGECPHELRRLFQHVRLMVEKKYGMSSDLRWQSVSAFCFLRFIVPAILHPHLFGLTPGLPPAPVQRSLTLVAKVIQSLANLNSGVQKEEFMRGVKIFMETNLPAMVDYILVVSTPVPEPYGPFPPAVADKHNRLHVTNSLRERLPTMPTLQREAVPLLPHLVDIPKHLAILTSAVVRGMRAGSQSAVFRPPSIGTEARLDDFAKRCFDVESRTLQCFRQLASRSMSNPYRMRSGSVSVTGPATLEAPTRTRRPTTSASQSSPGIPLSISTSTSTTGHGSSPSGRHPSPQLPTFDARLPRRRTRSLRPSTAPSGSSSASPQSSSDHSNEHSSDSSRPSPLRVSSPPRPREYPPSPARDGYPNSPRDGFHRPTSRDARPSTSSRAGGEYPSSSSREQTPTPSRQRIVPPASPKLPIPRKRPTTAPSQSVRAFGEAQSYPDESVPPTPLPTAEMTFEPQSMPYPSASGSYVDLPPGASLVDLSGDDGTGKKRKGFSLKTLLNRK